MLVLEKQISHFNLEETLECGQCFRYIKISDGHYKVIAFGKILEVKQIEDKVYFYDIDEEQYNKLWKSYFDLDRDYNSIKSTLSKGDSIISEAIKFKPGVRILKQDVWECLISFIISQNKQIPHIQQIIKNISEAFGTYIGEHNGEKLYSFPTVEQLAEATEQDIRALKAGFRAPYIVDATKKVITKEVDLNLIHQIPTVEAKKQLLKIKGVGNKIADCVLLFSLNRYEVFPIDVWVKRIMEYFYIKKETKLDVIQEFAKEKFGDYAGFAQQYLFYYAREKKVGK